MANHINKLSGFDFNIVKPEKKTIKRQDSTPSPPLHWIKNDCEWDKNQFVSDIANFIESTQIVNTFPNMVLIEMLGTQVDIYFQCVKKIEQAGLIESYNKGATTGPSVYFTIADKALNRAIQIMKELGLTPTHRVGVLKSQTQTQEALDLEEFLAGP